MHERRLKKQPLMKTPTLHGNLVLLVILNPRRPVDINFVKTLGGVAKEVQTLFWQVLAAS